MSRGRRSHRPAAASPPTRTTDGFENVAARLGANRGSQNLLAQSRYTIDPVTRNRVMLEAMYRSSWIVRAVVGVVAEDMLRAGIDFQGSTPPEDLKRLRRALTRTGSWRLMTAAAKWGRLYGGAVAVIGIRGQDMSTPLRPETVGRGGFAGLRVYNRWQLQPSTELVQEDGPQHGMPVSYGVLDSGHADAPAGGPIQARVLMSIHGSRCMRLTGEDLPSWQAQTEQGWGMSVIEPMYDRLLAYDSTTLGVAQMVYRAHLRTLKIKDFKQNIAMGGDSPQFAAQMQMIDMIRAFQTMEGMTLLDADDTIEALSYAFQGLDSVLQQMGSQVCGATRIPAMKLFGHSPAGFSTGDADLQSYYDNINLRQEHELRDPFSRLLEVLHWSELGRAPDQDFDFDFASLWGLSEEEKAQVAGGVTSSVVAAYSAQIISRSTALRELQEVGSETGVFSSITDEDIAAAEAEETVPDVPPGVDPSAMGADPSDPSVVDPSADPTQPDYTPANEDIPETPGPAPAFLASR